MGDQPHSGEGAAAEASRQEAHAERLVLLVQDATQFGSAERALWHFTNLQASVRRDDFGTRLSVSGAACARIRTAPGAALTLLRRSRS